VAELLPLEPGERVLCLTTLTDGTAGWAVGTQRGVVKRVNPEIIAKDSWEIIRLEPGDALVGAVELPGDQPVDLVFVTSDAQVLHFGADTVRPQGRAGGGMAGVKLTPGSRALFFGAAAVDTAVVVTVAGSSAALPGTEAGTVKVTPLAEYPGKGRATGGVRCQRFLKGEDALLLAWVGDPPAVAAAASGSPIDLPPLDRRRDASGTPSGQPIAAVGGRRHR